MKSAFDKIMAGINDVTAYAKGDETRARIVWDCRCDVLDFHDIEWVE